MVPITMMGSVIIIQSSCLNSKYFQKMCQISGGRPAKPEVENQGL